jgi:hypothetical protein
VVVGGGSFYKVSYSYTIVGRAYFQKQYVSTEHYADFDTNTDVQVLCLANYPTVAILAEDNGNFLYFAFCTIMLFGLTVFMILQALR